MTASIGVVQQRNLIVRGGKCNHRKYIPKLVGLGATGAALDPTSILTNTEPITGAMSPMRPSISGSPVGSRPNSARLLRLLGHFVRWTEGKTV